MHVYWHIFQLVKFIYKRRKLSINNNDNKDNNYNYNIIILNKTT